MLPLPHRRNMQGHDMETIDYNKAAAAYRSIVESMLFVIGHTLTCIGIGLALGLAIGNIHNTKK